MSRTLFRLEIPQAVQNENLDGRELTRRGFAVNKYATAGATPIVTDNAQAFVDALNAQQAGSAAIDTGNRLLTITNADRLLPAGEFTLVGWKVVIGTDPGIPAPLTGSLSIEFDMMNRNVHFYNCNVEIRNLSGMTNVNQFAIGYGWAGNPPEPPGNTNGERTRADDQFGDSAAVSRGINSYGSLWIYSRGNVRNDQSIRFADLIDSEIIFISGEARFDGSGGGRHIRSTLNKYEGAAQQIRPYGNNIVEASVYNNFFFRHGNTGPNQPSQLVLDRPAFLPTGAATAQNSFVDLNIGDGVVTSINNNIAGVTLDARSFPVQMIGGPSLGASVDDAFGNVETNRFGLLGTAGYLSMDSVERGYSGFNQYYGVGDRYFADGAQTIGAQGIRVRIDGTINPTTVESANLILGNRAFTDLATFTTGNISLIGQTGADGRLETFEWISGTDRRSGHINWFEWRDEAGTGGNVWATNVDQTFSPPGMMLMPIARAYITNGASDTPGVGLANADRNYDNVRVNVRRRGFRWDVNEPLTQIMHPALGDQLEIPAGNIIAPDLLGVRVKAAFVNADNTPNDLEIARAFPGGETTSLNDIDNAFRSLWFEEQTDHTPDNEATVADNYDLNIDNSISAPFTITSTGGSTTFNVRANGLAPEADDVFRNRTFNSVGLNGVAVDAQDISAGIILGARTGTTPAQFAFRNCDVIGGLTLLPGESYYFDNVNVSQLRIAQTGSGTTTIRGTDHEGNALELASFANANGTYVFEAPPITLMMQPDVANEEQLRRQGGFWRAVRADGTVMQTHNITMASTLADVTYTFFSDETLNIRGYYQPAGTVGGYVADFGYVDVNPSTQTMPLTFRATPREYTLLVADTRTDRSGELNITTVDAGTATAVLNVRVTVTAIAAGVGLNHTQEIAIAILSNEQYIDAVIARGYNQNQRIIEFLLADRVITQYNGGLGTGGTPERPVINLFVEGGTMSGIAFTQGHLSNPTTGNSMFFDTTAVTVFVGINDAVAALENSNTLQEIDNKTSYLVTNGGRTQTDVSLQGGRLGGLRPKQADYNTDIDYTTVT